MNITIHEADGSTRAYTVSPEGQERAIEWLFKMVLDRYQTIDTPLRITMKAIAREVLRRLEAKASDDARAVFRPNKGDDPVLHLVTVGRRLLAGGIEHADVHIEASNRHAITAVRVAGKDTGQSGG